MVSSDCWLVRPPFCLKWLFSRLPVVAGRNIALPLVLLRSRYAPLPKAAGDGLVVVVDVQTPPPVLAGSRHVLPSVPAVDGCIPASAGAGCG